VPSITAPSSQVEQVPSRGALAVADLFDVGPGLAEIDVFPDPSTNPEFYVDFGETGPYVKEIGDSECAT
jgi:hypothetical protein